MWRKLDLVIDAMEKAGKSRMSALEISDGIDLSPNEVAQVIKQHGMGRVMRFKVRHACRVGHQYEYELEPASV